jgi:hypothetical protein
MIPFLYEVKVINGKQFLFYKGEKLEGAISTTVSQNSYEAEDKIGLVRLEVTAKLIDTK